MIKSIENLEHQAVAQRLQQIDIAVGFELDNLERTAIDWAEWDDPYQFVVDGNQEFIDNNLGLYFFDSLRLNSIIYMNTTGVFVYAQELRNEHTELEPVPDGIRQELKRLVGDNLDADRKYSGILSTPEGVILFATNPILTSNSDGPVHGNMIIFRYLDDTEITYLSKMIGSAIVIEENMPQDIRESQKDANGVSLISTENLSSQTIQATGSLNDIYGKPAVLVRLNMSREMNKIGRDGVQTVMLTLLITCFILLLLIISYTNRVILSRVLAMNSAIKNIGETNNSDERLKHDRHYDELSVMT